MFIIPISLLLLDFMKITSYCTPSLQGKAGMLKVAIIHSKAFVKLPYKGQTIWT